MSQPDDAAFFTADFTALPAEQVLKKWRQQVLDSERDRAAYIQACVCFALCTAYVSFTRSWAAVGLPICERQPHSLQSCIL
jgi:hypothetical protein